MLLIVGLYQFLYAFYPEQKSTPLLTRCVNFLNSVPNDDDIMDAYAIEHSQFTIGRDQQKKVLLRGAKLSYCLPCYWQGNVRVKVNSNSSAGELKWVSAFLLVQVVLMCCSQFWYCV